MLKGHETHRRSFIKAATWRMTGTVDTIVLSFFVTGSFKMAASIGVAELFTKIFLYWLHERIWSKVKWGYKKAT